MNRVDCPRRREQSALDERRYGSVPAQMQMYNDHAPVRVAAPSREGAALMLCLVLLAVTAVMTGVSVQRVLKTREQQLRNEEYVQAVRLAESGLRRAVARHARDPKYAGETWDVPAELLNGRSARIIIARAVDDSKPDELTWAATAEFPVTASQPVRVTRGVTVHPPP